MFNPQQNENRANKNKNNYCQINLSKPKKKKKESIAKWAKANQKLRRNVKGRVNNTFLNQNAAWLNFLTITLIMAE